MRIQFCPYCGTKLDEGARFCKNCGEAVGNEVQEELKPKQDETDNQNQTKRKIVYDGSIHKCPNCGELLKSFTTVCSACGYELRSVKTNSPVETLVKKMERASSLEEKIELITNFYIPNTKEDIYDFFILAVSNLEDKWYDTDDAWRAKLEQAYHKAKLSFGNTPEFEYLEKLYIRTRKEVNRRERGVSSIFRRNKVAFIATLLAAGGLIMLIVGIIMMISGVEIGVFLLLMSMACFCFIPAVSELVGEDKKKTSIKKKETCKKNGSTVLPIGRDAEDFYGEHYDDMAEFLRSNGFKNVVTKPVRKGVLDTEGDIEDISIAGNTEFCEDDVFDVNSRIIIRYYSRNYKNHKGE